MRTKVLPLIKEYTYNLIATLRDKSYEHHNRIEKKHQYEFRIFLLVKLFACFESVKSNTSNKYENMSIQEHHGEEEAHAEGSCKGRSCDEPPDLWVSILLVTFDDLTWKE
jgi:hypothetical protein